MSAPLSRRLQVLIDEERMERLRRESERTGAPVGAVVRQAIDARLGLAADRERAASAARRLLDAEPMPVEDWGVEKARMADELYGGGR
jgi:predicted DNA-binding protein